MMLHQPQDPYLLERSWQRSRDYGLSQHSRVDRLCLLRPDLQQRKQQHAQLLRYLNSSLPLFEQLQQGRRCRLLFADAEGTILFSAGDPYFGNKAQKMALANGASWHEQSMGTNAIGTALSEQKEICILGQQHFLAANHGISCSASPVLSPNGEL
ncbi:MAG: sigma-54-dependent Fis family transcriptional regulator, partial [Oceanisphaera sp.]|nr:sigma-54-dependent Fis family transcriptional regulator [Oceanisphaera sp.]